MLWYDLPNDLFLELLFFTGWTCCISLSRRINEFIKKQLEIQFQKVDDQQPKSKWLDFLTEHGSLFTKMIPEKVSTERLRKFVVFYTCRILSEFNHWRQLVFYQNTQLHEFISNGRYEESRLSIQLFLGHKKYYSLFLDTPWRIWNVYEAFIQEEHIFVARLFHMNQFKDKMVDDILINWLLLPNAFIRIAPYPLGRKQNPCQITKRFSFSLTEEEADPKECILVRGCQEEPRLCDSRIVCLNH